MGKIIDNIAKGICATVAIFAVLLLIGLLFGGDMNNSSAAPKATPTIVPTVTPTQIESSIEEHIIVYKDGQDDIVECKRLSIFGRGNVIQIANSDVEKIVITGDKNSISYSCDANPQIIDSGNHNCIWQRWLT